MRASEYRALARALGADALHDADPTMARLRLLKDDTEIAELRQAIQISETALEETLMAGICGHSGHEISGRLKAAMLAHGATGFAFEPIVLSGEEAANPHGDTSARTIGPGDALLIDFGASWGSMHADITRTVFCDHAPEEHAKIYETVLAANQAGRAAARPGDAIGAVDSAATGVLAASPYADMILHKTGHGLGREVHEAPTVVSSNLETLQPGMVFTIEPGLYRDGEIGVRIEDDILMTETGHDCLTGFDRELKTYA
jgi:Xaa-Pro dipeptidase